MSALSHQFAAALWHHDTADSRSLQDSRVETLTIRGNRNEIGSVGIEVQLLMLVLCVLGILVIVVARLDERITRIEWDRWGSLAKFVKPPKLGAK